MDIFNWSTLGKLIQLDIDEDSMPSKSLIFKYDGLDRRIEKQFVDFKNSKNSYTKRYIYDGEDIILELDGSNAIKALFVHGEGIDDPLMMIRDENDNQIFEDKEVYAYTKDHLGSIREIVDYNGETKQRYSYSSYGETKIAKVNPKDELIDSPYAYTSRELDLESGDMFYRARYYSPNEGRFVSEDPIGFDGGDSNLYRYVKSSPVLNNDPSGNLSPASAATCIVAFTIGGVYDAVSSIKDQVDFQNKLDNESNKEGKKCKNNTESTFEFLYKYDKSSRLTESSFENLYGLDPLGNRIGSGYLHNANNQLLESPEWSFAYDLDGNLLQKVHKEKDIVYNYTWSTLGKLIQLDIDEDSMPSKSLMFKYDGLDRRIEKQFIDFKNSRNSYTKRYVYDGEDIILELDGSNTVKALFVHGEGIDDPLMMIRDENDNRIFEDKEVYAYTKDHLGSIREIVDYNGEVKQRYTYSSYGETKIAKTNPKDEFIDSPYAYTSRELDLESGDMFYRARYYSPSEGRFVSEDPIGFEGGDQNIYRYANGDVISNSDPYGLDFRECTRPLDGVPFGSHKYFEIDDGSTVSWGANGGPFGKPGGFINESNKPQEGRNCGPWQKSNKSVEDRMKDWAKKNSSRNYHLTKYNCYNFTNDAIKHGLGN